MFGSWNGGVWVQPPAPSVESGQLELLQVLIAQTAPTAQFTGQEPTLLQSMLQTEPGRHVVLHVPVLLQSMLQTEPVSHLKSQRPVTLLQRKFAILGARDVASQPEVELQ